MARAARSWLPRWQTLLKLAALVGLVVAANLVAGALAEALRFELRPSNEDLVHRVLMASAVGYAALLAIPFVPGVEIGLALIASLGAPVVPLVYLCTLAGLSASFAVGRLIPLPALGRLLHRLRLRRTGELLARVAPMGREERLAFLLRRAPPRLVPSLLRHRHVALAVVLNLPGNFLIGGGGGIALVAGLSGLYSVPAFVLTIAIAVSPLPLAVLLFGDAVLPG